MGVLNDKKEAITAWTKACKIVCGTRFGRTCGAILFRTEVREVMRAEGPAVHPAKGEALVYRPRRVLYILLCLAVFGPTGQEFA